MSNKSSNPYKRIAGYIESLPKELLSDYRIAAQDYDDNVIPFEVYKGTHGYIERIADQINKAYHFEIYDGCLVLMRRLIETLLILAFKELKIESEILDEDGNHLHLSKIIDKSITNKTLALTRNSKQSLKPFALGGNLSAHNLYFCARSRDLSPHFRLQFRSLVEELLNKAGVLK